MKKTIIFTAAILVLILFSGPMFAQDQEKYTNESVAQLSYVDGKVFIQRPSDLGFEDGTLNTPVSDGDRIGTAEGRAEIHFGRGNYLRLDENTKIDIMDLPKKDDNHIRFRVWSGHVYIVVGTIRGEKTIEVHTPDSSFYVLENGIYRVDVRENKDTEILVFEGLLEAAGADGSQLIKSGQRIEIGEGKFKDGPAAFMATAEDPFDEFNQSRNSQMAGNVPNAKGNLPEEINDYEGQLDQNGRWAYVEPYGKVWVPGGVDESWRPYYNGRWTWIGLTGWTWVPYEPWGWVTFHYGRWGWGGGLGWYWIPTSIWGPAWVSWWNDMDYIGWSPLSWYGYPGILMGGMYYGHGDYHGDYYPGGSRALTVVRRNQLRDGNVAALSLRGESVRGLKRISMTKERLQLSPDGAARVTIQNIENNRVILKRDSTSSKLVRSDGKSAVSPKTLPDGKRSIEPRVKEQGSSSSGAIRPGSATPRGSQPAERKIRKNDNGTSGGPSPSGTSSGSMRTYPSSSSGTRGNISGNRSGSSRGSSSPRMAPRSGSSSRGSSSSVQSRGSSKSSGRSGSVSRRSSGSSGKSSGSRSSSRGSSSSGGGGHKKH